MNPTQKLISLVRSNPCLYSSSDRDFKNTYKKESIWETIAKELGKPCDATKMRWKNLKDGYTKYKKQTLGQCKKKTYVNWIWAPQLHFLDSVKQPPASTSTEVPLEDNTIPIEHIKTSPASSPNSNSSHFNEYITNEEIMPASSPAQQMPSPSHLTDPLTTRKRKLEDLDDVDKVLDYLKNKRRQDATDLLFASYAASFKKLSPRTQASLKLQLAQIFAEAELSDFEYKNENIHFT